jgi:hypothetical protein
LKTVVDRVIARSSWRFHDKIAVGELSSLREFDPEEGKEQSGARPTQCTARSGKGGKDGKVKSRKRAIAIGLSKARKKGKWVPKKK